MTLDEIRKLLCIRDAPTEDCAEVIGILDAHIGHVASRIRELRVLEEQLNCLRERCQAEQTIGDCGILQGLAAMENEPTHERHTHLG